MKTTSFRMLALRAVLAGTAFFMPLLVSAQITFYGIGDLSGGGTYSEVRDATRVSGTITAVGGGSANSGSTTMDTAVTWTISGGLVTLPNIVANTTATNPVFARVITPDGSVIGGNARNIGSGGSREGAIWTSGGTVVTGTGYVPGGSNQSAVNSLSSNGAVAYGFSLYDGTSNLQAFRYASSTLTALGFLNGGDTFSTIASHGAAADGLSAVGTSGTAAGLGAAGDLAFRYVFGSGMSALPLLTGGNWSVAMTITPDGVKGVGFGDSTSQANGELIRWTFGGATEALGTPNAAWTFQTQAGVSADGSVIVASMTDGVSGAATYLRNANGWFDLQAVAGNAGVNLTGWSLTSVTGMSADGTLVFGVGTHNGSTEGWLMDVSGGYLAGITAVPEPSTYAALAGGASLLAATWHRRRRARIFATRA